ncbi:50S ribosomal protein L29 [uncultured Cardiobacterium sp.]|uniref:50S ribosomal protein L29 n=1 Tax=uncultured Cardiobacterium sp. TaxID=417619 RepID=UPI0026037626|nr:50S ribosomal protein L29 [uncultured Cardiobacterium sp.]
MPKTLLNQNIASLLEELITLRQAQFKLTMHKLGSNLDKPHQILQVRRNIARIKTLLRQHGVKV